MKEAVVCGEKASTSATRLVAIPAKRYKYPREIRFAAYPPRRAPSDALMAQPAPVIQMTVCSLAWKSLPMPENKLIAATAPAGARKSAKPVRHSFVLEACHVAFSASVNICLKWKEDFFG